MSDPRIVPCTRCGSEGRLYSGPANDPNPRDEGPCPVCEGTGGEIIETEPVTLDDLCADGCQYAKDVAMFEHSCSGECQYRLAAAHMDDLRHEGTKR